MIGPMMNDFLYALRNARAISINHLGYETAGLKTAVFCLGDGGHASKCTLLRISDDQVVFTIPLSQPQAVAGWKGNSYQVIDFSEFTTPGSYRICVYDTTHTLEYSEDFEIAAALYHPQLSRMMLGYFQSQRCGDQYTDTTVPFFSGKRTGHVDVHGGWYDASGDVSKYLSHLSYANYMNPQQTPLVVWALANAAENSSTDLGDDFGREAVWGADFLVRMFDPAGYFYMTVFDKWSGDVEQREICSYSTQDGIKHDSWQAGFRQGGGMAIAALARLSRLGKDGDFSAGHYGEIAQQGFQHLLTHNTQYLDDGVANIIDDYCALLAAVELHRATDNPDYIMHADNFAKNLMARLTKDGWWHADANGARPFFHASDAGMPMVALAAYAEICGAAEKQNVVDALNKSVQHLNDITHAVFNPFSYPRQFVKSSAGALGSQFFFPHENESGYWWQGENARLASIAYGLKCAKPLVDSALHMVCDAHVQHAIDWILGLNPYQSCMMQGVGRNTPTYQPAKFPNVDGGICNGITSGLENEADIGFCDTEDPMQSWRWSEQWLPHAAWFLLAVSAK